jgi:hypothetical protein
VTASSSFASGGTHSGERCKPTILRLPMTSQSFRRVREPFAIVCSHENVHGGEVLWAFCAGLPSGSSSFAATRGAMSWSFSPSSSAVSELFRRAGSRLQLNRANLSCGLSVCLGTTCWRELLATLIEPKHQTRIDWQPERATLSPPLAINGTILPTIFAQPSAYFFRVNMAPSCAHVIGSARQIRSNNAIVRATNAANQSAW